MAYASFEVIRGSSELRIVQDADDGQLTRWSDAAKGAIDQFCSRDFFFEPAVEYAFHVTNPLIVLHKEISNITAATMTDVNSGAVDSAVDVAAEFYIMPPSNRLLRFRRIATGPNHFPISAKLVAITADWGLPVMPEPVTRVFLRLVERAAARSHEDDVLQMHSAYTREDDGDEYSYDRGNATVRAFLRPEDRAELFPWVARGRAAT